MVALINKQLTWFARPVLLALENPEPWIVMRVPPANEPS